MTDDKTKAADELLALMARLRTPVTGCPWDLEQNFKTIAPYTIEEAYEVADAIERDDMTALKDELGDLLLQVVFHARMAEEAGLFDFNDVARHVTAKMIHRHPHVFGDAVAKTAGDVANVIWEQQKAKEKTGKTQAESILDDVPVSLPSMIRAQKLQKRAASVGFEWAQAIDVLDKLEEETGEMREALKSGREAEIKDELGDLFFVLVNFARMLDLNAEEVLRGANSKFERRFRGLEKELKARGKALKGTTLAEMEQLWQDVKKRV